MHLSLDDDEDAFLKNVISLFPMKDVFLLFRPYVQFVYLYFAKIYIELNSELMYLSKSTLNVSRIVWSISIKTDSISFKKNLKYFNIQAKTMKTVQ